MISNDVLKTSAGNLICVYVWHETDSSTWINRPDRLFLNLFIGKSIGCAQLDICLLPIFETGSSTKVSRPILVFHFFFFICAASGENFVKMTFPFQCQYDKQDQVDYPAGVAVVCHSYVDGLVQDCSISSALAMEILQSCTKPSTCRYNMISNVSNCIWS